jgi:hypothetical protein
VDPALFQTKAYGFMRNLELTTYTPGNWFEALISTQYTTAQLLLIPNAQWTFFICLLNTHFFQLDINFRALEIYLVGKYLSAVYGPAGFYETLTANPHWVNDNCFLVHSFIFDKNNGIDYSVPLTVKE